MATLNEELKQALMNAAMGDENAINALATYLERTAPRQQPTPEQLNAFIEREVAARTHGAFEGFRERDARIREGREIFDQAADPVGYRAIAEVDAKLHSKNPQMPTGARYDRAEEIVTGRIGTREERDTAEALAVIGQGRHIATAIHDPNDPMLKRAREKVEELEEEGTATDYLDASEAEIDAEHTLAIREIAESRKGRAVEANADLKRLDEMRRQQRRAIPHAPR